MTNEKQLGIKVCGMANAANAAAVAQAGADYVGFIFFEHSPRYMGHVGPQLAAAIPPQVQRVGVFVNHDNDFIEAQVQTYRLDLLQLHGHEPVSQVQALKAKGHAVMKVFSVNDDFDFAATEPYEPYVDFFLFDTKGKDYGGNGVTFDWSVLNRYRGQKPFFLSGGIGPAHIESIAQLQHAHPMLVAVDVNSRFETKPGYKNIDMVQAFVDGVRALPVNTK